MTLSNILKLAPIPMGGRRRAVHHHKRPVHRMSSLASMLMPHRKRVVHRKPMGGARHPMVRFHTTPSVGNGHRHHSARKHTGGFAWGILASALAPLAMKVAEPVLGKIGSKIGSLLGLGGRRKVHRKRTVHRGYGVIRAGATRKSGGRRRVHHRKTGGSIASLLRALRR